MSELVGVSKVIKNVVSSGLFWLFHRGNGAIYELNFNNSSEGFRAFEYARQAIESSNSVTLNPLVHLAKDDCCFALERRAIVNKLNGSILLFGPIERALFCTEAAILEAIEGQLFGSEAMAEAPSTAQNGGAA